MAPLTLLLVIKIIVTFAMVALPFLLFPKARLETAMAITAASGELFRLYGAAILALLVGYAGGVWQVSQGAFPWGVVAMGVVSNGGAFLVLLKTGAAARYKFLTVFFGVVALCLVAATVFRNSAISPLF